MLIASDIWISAIFYFVFLHLCICYANLFSDKTHLIKKGLEYPFWDEFKLIVHVSRQQYLIYWKRYQHMHSEGVHSYWQVISCLQIWFLWWNKIGFLPSCGCINTTVWMHHLDAHEMHGEKARLELHKNNMYCFEQIPEATLHKTAPVWPPNSHLTNHSSKMNKTCWTLREK